MLAGAALVGREVLVPSSRAVLGEAGEVRGAIDVPEGAQQLLVTVRDAAGQVVRQMTVAAGAGLVDFRWDGVTGDGGRAPPGEYSLGAIAIGAGRNVSLPLLLTDQVRSVTLDTSGKQFVLNTHYQGSVRLADVRRIG
jgi:flagellar basal-body rod modification protein FlgD